MKSSKCRTHNTHGCVCMWSTAQLSKAGIAIGHGGVGMDARTIGPSESINSATGAGTDEAFARILNYAKPTKAAANDALTDDEKSLIAMAIRSVQRPARRTVAQASPQFHDALGNPVEHQFLTFDSQPIVTRPAKWKPVQALPKVRR